MIKSISLALCLTIGTVCSCAHADDAAAQETFKIDGKAIKLARYAKALIGEGNVTVEIAPYKMGDKDGAILLIQGVESDWDGKAINHSVDPAPRGGQDYATTHDGKRWVTLVMRKNEGGNPVYELYVPGVKDEIALAPSDGAAQATNPRKIFQEYQKQRSQK